MSAGSGLPVAVVPADAKLYRVHGDTVGARWYGRRDAGWRWDAPDGSFGVLYLGRSLIGPFAETLLRTPTQTELLWSRVRQKRSARFVARRPIRLARAHGPGLSYFRTTVAGVSADFDPVDNPGAYGAPQTISAWIHAHTDLDGIQYRSRIDSDALCVALFDRADMALADDREGLRIRRDWVERQLATRGITLIDL